jgi:DNA gyrase subunit A
MLRTDLKELREIGRATQGVRLIRLDEADRVVAVAKIVREEDGENGGAVADAGGPGGTLSVADAAGGTLPGGAEGAAEPPTEG